MKDLGILIIKPEVIKKEKEIKEYLKTLGYEIIEEISKKNWRKLAAEIYKEFSPDEIKTYLKGYDKHKFGNKFIILLLKHNKGKTIAKLKNNQGHFLKYQKSNNSIRAKFGLPEKYNINYESNSKSYIFTYSGIHVAKDKKELEDHSKLLGIKI